VRGKGLLLVPYINRTRCGDWSDHPKQLKEWYRQRQAWLANILANIVAAAETRHPGDAGKMKERAILIRVAQWLRLTVAHHQRLETIEYCSIYTIHIVIACSTHFYNACYPLVKNTLFRWPSIVQACQAAERRQLICWELLQVAVQNAMKGVLKNKQRG
jgi:hypothetical protein